MREILFRGKRYDNGQWVYGYLIHNEFCNSNIPYIGYLRLADTNADEVIPSTVGQYTGLIDKNGTKIFEGDIVKDEDSQLYGKVVFATAADGFDGMTGFMVDDICDGLQNYNGFWHFVEVIGNIHDNPELLKGV